MNVFHNHDPSIEPPAPRRGRVSTIRIWGGLFGMPAAWLAQVFLSEPLAAHACYPYQAPLSAPIWQGLPVILAAISIGCFAAALLSEFVAWSSWRQSESKPTGEGGSVINNTVELSSSKASPAGQIRLERIWSRRERPQGSGQDSPETLGWVTTARMQEVEQRREQLPRGNQNSDISEKRKSGR